MNPLPSRFNYPHAGGVASADGAPTNPVPGQWNPIQHGPRIGWSLLKWAEAVRAGTDALAAQAGNDILQDLCLQHVTQGVVTPLKESLQGVINAVDEANHAREALARAKSFMQGGADKDAKGSARGIDWYEPNKLRDRFYVLDRESGKRLTSICKALKNAKAYLARGARVPNRLFFVGAQGTGKTAGALWLGAQLQVPVALLRVDGVIGGQAGESAQNLRACAEAAVERNAILVLDEFEAIAVPRTTSGPNVPQWSKELTAAVLQLFDWLDEFHPTQVFIGATNVPEAVDPAARRRLRTPVVFHPPDRAAREVMVDRWWGKAPHDVGARRRLLDLTEGLSGDVLERACDHANCAATERAPQASITEADVQTAIDDLLAVDQAVLARGGAVS